MCTNKIGSSKLVKKQNKKQLIFTYDMLTIVWMLSPNPWHVCYAFIYVVYSCYSAVFSSLDLYVAFEMQLSFYVCDYKLYVTLSFALNLFLSN